MGLTGLDRISRLHISELAIGYRKRKRPGDRYTNDAQDLCRDDESLMVTTGYLVRRGAYGPLCSDYVFGAAGCTSSDTGRARQEAFF